MSAVMALLVSIIIFTAATLTSAELNLPSIITAVLLCCSVFGYVLLLSAVASDITAERKQLRETQSE